MVHLGIPRFAITLPEIFSNYNFLSFLWMKHAHKKLMKIRSIFNQVAMNDCTKLIDITKPSTPDKQKYHSCRSAINQEHIDVWRSAVIQVSILTAYELYDLCGKHFCATNISKFRTKSAHRSVKSCRLRDFLVITEHKHYDLFQQNLWVWSI